LGVLDEALRKKLFYDKERRVLGLREVLEDHEKQTLKEKMPELQPAIETLIKQADQGLFADGLRTIDLGAGHASAGETLCGRVVAALKSQALLNESIGAGYIERHWPPALKQSGAWPLSSLRQSFLNGALTRLLDPDSVLRGKVVEFVGHGDFGLASGQRPDGYYEHVWYAQIVSPDEVTFDAGVFLLTKAKAKDLTSAAPPKPEPKPGPEPEPQPRPEDETKPGEKGKTRTLHLVGMIPLEVWNRVGVKLLPKLKSGSGMKIVVDFSVTVNADLARSFETDLRQILADLNLTDKVRIEES
jgi:hypothetical protein